MQIELYDSLVDDCKSIITEAVFTSRWSLVEGHWLLGQRLRQEGEVTKLLTGLSVKIGVSERDLWRSLSFYDKYNDISLLPEGKNITWNKIVTKYLPENKENKECEHEYIEICKFCHKRKI